MLETLGDYRKLCLVLYGEDSQATKFIDDKIDEQGEGERVVQHESQMLMLLTRLHTNKNKEKLHT